MGYFQVKIMILDEELYFLLPAQNNNLFALYVKINNVTAYKYSSKPSEMTQHILFKQKHVLIHSSTAPARYRLLPEPPKLL